MAHIEPNDFSSAFDKDFFEDMDFITDRCNDLLEDLDRNYGGQLTELVRDFGSFRNDFLKVLENIITNEVIRGRRSLDDVIVNAILAAAAVCAKTIRRGTRESEDFIADEFANNPFLEDLSRSSRRDGRGSDRSSSRYSRDSRNTRRSASDYHRRRDGGTSRTGRTERDDSRRSSRRSASVDTPRGRIAAVTKPTTSETVNETKQPQRTTSRRSQAVETVPGPTTTTLQSGDVVISENIAATGLSYGLLYLAGDEQVVYNGSALEVEEFTGANDVDYAKHRIDGFYPDILGDGNKTELTAIALREAEKVKDQTIKRFITDLADSEGETIIDPKLFQHAVSGSYETAIRFPTKAFSPVEVRDTLVENHTGNLEWFTKYALFVKAEQAINLADVTNDNLVRMQQLIDSDKVLDTLSNLITLSDKIDPVVWRILHDYITTGFNKRLVSLDLGITVESITADWSAFRAWLQENRPEYAETLNMKNGIMQGIALELTEEENNLVIQRNTLFLPINSYDLDFATATASEGFAVLNEQSKIYRFVNDLMTDSTSVLYITTLDCKTLAVRDISGVMGVRYFVTKE